MAQELISEIFDVEKIGQQVKNISTLITDWLNTTKSELKDLTNKSIELHLNIKSDANFKDLIANMKEFAKVSQQIETAGQKVTNVQNHIAAAANLSGKATKEIIFYQEKQKKSTEDMATALDSASDAYRFYSDSLRASKQDLADNSAALAKAREQVKEYSKKLADMQSKASWTPVNPKSITELEEKLGNAAARVEEYTQKVKENKQQVKLAQTVEDGLGSSYEVREAMMRQLIQVSKGMGTETDEEKFHQMQLAEAINTLNESLKESDEAWGNNQRKVGTYENATKGLRGIITDLTNEMAAMVLAGEANSEEYQKAQAQVTEYNKALMNVRKTTNGLRSDTAGIDALRQSLQALNVAFISLKQIGGFGEDSEKLNAIMKKLQGTIALVSASVEVYNLVGKNSLVIAKLRTVQANLLAKAQLSQAAATGKATVAQRLFNLVAKANPYLLLVSAIGLVIGAFALFSKRVSAAEQSQKDLNKAQSEAVKGVAEQAAKIEVLAKVVAKGNVSVAQQRNIILQLNQVVKDSGKEFKTWEDAQDFLVNKKDEYINSLKERAKQQAVMNEYTKAYGELLDAQMKKEAANQDSIKKYGKSLSELAASMGGAGDMLLKEIEKPIEKANQKMNFLFDQMNRDVSFEGLEKSYQSAIQSIDDATTTETQKLNDTFKSQTNTINAYFDNLINRQKTYLKVLSALNNGTGGMFTKQIENINAEIERLTGERNVRIEGAEKLHRKNLAKINESYVQQQREIAHTIEDLQIETMSGVSAGILGVSAVITSALSASLREHNKTLRQMETQRKREIEKVKGDAEQQATQVALINEKYRQKELQAQKDFAARQREIARGVQETNINNRLAVAQKGSQQEYELRIELLGQQRQAELDEAEKTGADRQAIIDKYAKAEKDAFEALMDGRIQAEMKEAEARLEVMNQMQGEEEQALLERYKNGEISTEQYEQTLAAIKQKYSDMATQDAIDNLEKILQAEGLSDEQIADLRKQLADKKKELSDSETAHTISNIEKENAKRKKSAELAKEYAQQAFETTMEFLTQISEAKIEAFDEELERIEAWKEAELARLDESVMSEETRAAEEKRIEDEAEAQRKKVEEEKRQEQAKQFRYQQLQSVAQTAINTAQSIVKTGAELGYPLAIPFIAVAAAMGAAQTALILAQKPPKYAKGIYGDESHEGGLAIVGDAYRKEYGLLPGGKVFETPAFPTLLDLPKYTQIFPDYSTFIRNTNPIPDYKKDVDYSANLATIKNEIVSAIKNNKSVQNVSIDKRGIFHVSNSKGTRTKIITSILK
ncbi:MAG: hypothetical protein LBK94_13385, partial [Prevotellaceae bacterium]|nr:hypothetical protein [Prevotellaceae bacterium]